MAHRQELMKWITVRARVTWANRSSFRLIKIGFPLWFTKHPVMSESQNGGGGMGGGDPNGLIFWSSQAGQKRQQLRKRFGNKDSTATSQKKTRKLDFLAVWILSGSDSYEKTCQVMLLLTFSCCGKVFFIKKRRQMPFESFKRTENAARQSSRTLLMYVWYTWKENKCMSMYVLMELMQHE